MTAKAPGDAPAPTFDELVAKIERIADVLREIGEALKARAGGERYSDDNG